MPLLHKWASVTIVTQFWWGMCDWPPCTGKILWTSIKRVCMAIINRNWYLELCRLALTLLIVPCIWQFEEEAMLVTRYQVPGRPTCLTVVGRRSPPTKLETAAEPMVLEPAEPVKEKKKKEKGKADRRTTSTSGNLVFQRISESRTFDVVL